MTCIQISNPIKRRGGGWLCIVPVFKPGDPPPKGYIEWHEWARVQSAAGRRQHRRACGHWHFSQEVCALADAGAGKERGDGV